ncbi:pectinesterase 3 isoform X2 [Telopea speciosissima]|uniref:pectinesterase 3 isoform X2 n=1 Tax=Telopea speciosissima TaxID=54955 RepID=UPI001CC64EBC|nr:pectinesterase 3 isoform X2 [Telopea speciosissima]
MDTIKSFKGYGKVDAIEDQAFRRKTRKRMIIVAVSVIVLLSVIIAAIVGVAVHNTNQDDGKATSSSPMNLANSIKAVCSVTQYPNSCFSSLSSLETKAATNKAADPEELFKLSMEAAVNELSKLSTLPDKLIARTNDVRDKAALLDCQSLYQEAIDQLNTSISSMQLDGNGQLLSASKIDDMKTWLSASLTDLQTCLDGLEETNSTALEEVRKAMQNPTELTSNSLAIVSKILALLQDFDLPIHRRRRKLLGFGFEFPEWVGPADRKLLHQEQNGGTTKANVTVANDGTGNFSTITEAVATIPKKSETRFLIYVKQGVYEENVVLDKSTWNVMMYGDGKAKTIISGNLSFVGGTPTFATATFVGVGDGFIARDIGIHNTAGPEAEQAVALNIASDRSVLYRCSIAGYQDSLYALAFRQFYRECDIQGSIDFIFGNAAAVFQSCNMVLRRPHSGGYNTILANGRSDPGQNTGFSVQSSRIVPSADFVRGTKAYLGRPWKQYSRSVVMQSSIDGAIAATGWVEWSGGFALKTLYFAEYQNMGPGAGTSQRVRWPGFHLISTADALHFTVANFIGGTSWLPPTGVTFVSGL